MKSWNRFAVFTISAIALTALAGCGGHSSVPPTPPTYTIGGSIAGLTGGGLVLQDNGASNLTVSANATSFTFATPVASGGAFSVTVLTQPASLTCKVTNGSGTASANVTSVTIACTPAYTIGGSILGLTGSGLVLEDNGAGNLTISSSATSYAFTFAGTIPSGGAPYSVTIATGPSGEECTVANPIGTATANVANVDISCTALPTVSYTISGTVSGLTGPGLVLQDQAGINDDDLLPVDANGNFAFVDPIAKGASYSVTVQTSPTGRNCGVTNGAGTASADVTNVSVLCLGEWTWENGPDTVPAYSANPGIYGTLGTAAPANIPGGRQQAVSWTDAAGNGWLFGGQGEDSTGVGYGGLLNDVWKFDPKLGPNGEWTWMGGSNVTPYNPTGGPNGEPGSYEAQGTPSATTTPGGREQTSSWLDASGNLWLFGGEGLDINGFAGQLNDLWKFNPTLGTTGEWTWMGGPSTVPDVPFNFLGNDGVYGTQGTPSPSNIPGGRYGAASWVDKSGNFWLFGGNGADAVGSNGTLIYLNDLWKYTPSATGDTGQWTWMGGSNLGGMSGVYGTQGTAAPANIPGGRDAPVSWTDPSGNLWLFGGIGYDSAGNQGFLNDLWEYTPSATGDTGQWTWMGGSSTLLTGVQGNPGVYGTLGVPAAANTPGGRFSAVSWTDAAGNLWLFSGDGFDSVDAGGYLDDLWKYTPSTTGGIGQWTWMGGSSTVGRSQGQSGVYGTLGQPGVNIPGGRYGASGYIDGSGGLWLFGGAGYDSVGNQGNLNDLWKYQP